MVMSMSRRPPSASPCRSTSRGTSARSIRPFTLPETAASGARSSANGCRRKASGTVAWPSTVRSGDPPSWAATAARPSWTSSLIVPPMPVASLIFVPATLRSARRTSACAVGAAGVPARRRSAVALPAMSAFGRNTAMRSSGRSVSDSRRSTCLATTLPAPVRRPSPIDASSPANAKPRLSREKRAALLRRDLSGPKLKSNWSSRSSCSSAARANVPRASTAKG